MCGMIILVGTAAQTNQGVNHDFWIFEFLDFWIFDYPIGWRGSIFRGFSPTLRPATTKTTRQVATNPIIYSSIDMPRNKISDDLDHVREDPKSTQPPKQPPPRP